MKSPRSRFSHRHLLALCTFLVPLGVLAILGQSELRRQGDLIEAGLSSEALLYLENAVAAVEQQIDRLLPPLVDESRDLLADNGPVHTALQLREQEHYGALLDILVLDQGFGLVWPEPPPTTMSLPFARDERGREPESPMSRGLNAVDLLLTTGRHAEARELLQHIVQVMTKANVTRRDPYPQARFRLATVQLKLGETDAARAGFEEIRDSWLNMRRGYDNLSLLSETALAELGSSSDRIDLLHRIANNRRYSRVADGLMTAVVERIVDGIPESDPTERSEALLLLDQERQRAHTRAFAGDYDLILKGDLRRRLSQSEAPERAWTDVQVVATLGRATTMLWVREATDDEREQFSNALYIGLHIDLDQLLAPALDPFIATDSSFVLAVHDPRDEVPLLAPPATIPADFVPPRRDARGLRLSAYPANAAELLADADARARNRVLLLLALFVATMAGALWLWRSVSREAELAALKVDLVSRVSHELKTPLALIRMYGETLHLGRAKDSDQARQFGGIVSRESERLTTMIQRILDFSRQQAGTLTYEPTRVDLRALLHRICDAYTPHLEARGAILSDMVHADAEVLCDENACESAVVNLLENAAKYAIEGDDEQEIELGLEVDRESATIEVRDRGRGIPDAENGQVFDPFFRASNSGEVRGAGIGLSLVQHFAKSHGGDVSAHARDGGGAVFRLALPLADRPTATITETP